MDFFSAFSSPAILGSSLTDYFIQSNFAGQVIVVILVVFSILAWGVMFCKKADLSAIEAMNAKTARMVKSKNLVEAAASNAIEGPYAKLLKEAVNAWMTVGLGNSAEDKTSRIAFVENTLERTLSRQIMLYNSKMTLLGTIISGAPFLGLLGTAWGVMDCFGSMSSEASVTLQMLAPGVAGALLTTVAGLVVAIPSVFGYNFLTAFSGKLTTETENFATLLADRVEIEAREHAEASERSVAPVQPAPVPVRSPSPQFRSVPRTAESAPASENKVSPQIMNFSLDDEDDASSPTPPRQFDE